MNSKINELAERADCTIDGLGYGEGNIEKFAEKIIQECIDVISRHSDPFAQNSYIKVLKEHFGIE
jgi:hypothetical protein